MKDKLFIKILTVLLALFIALSIYQVLIIRNLKSNLKAVTADRNRVVEKYNQKERNGVR